MSAADLLLRARRHCYDALRAERAQSGAGYARAIYLAALLYEVEQLSPADLADPSAGRQLLELAADTALAAQLADLPRLARRLRRERSASVAELRAALADARHAYGAALAGRAAPQPLPHRRALSQREAAARTAELEQARRALARATLWDIDADRLEVILRFIEAERPQLVLNLWPSGAIGYELDPAWAREMFAFDDTIWAARDLSWYLVASGHGYPVVAGDLLGATGG